jgi:hypothetical protein
LQKVLGSNTSTMIKDTREVFEEQQVRIFNRRQALLEGL